MTHRWSLVAGVLVLGVCHALLGGQPPAPPTGGSNITGFNERVVEKRTTPEDKTGIWMLDFYFKDPRVITVDIPGRGRSIVWYLWYQVANGTGEPRDFIPEFVWVSHDVDKAERDQVLPKAQMAIQRLEDPDNIHDIQNSNSIAQKKIPVSKEFDDRGQRIAFPKLVTGVATWDNIDPKSTQFSIFVFGLSDGYSMVDGPDGKTILRSKALQLKFKRIGDERPDSGQIRYQGFEWVYATRDLPIPVLSEPPKLPKNRTEGAANSPATSGRLTQKP